MKIALISDIHANIYAFEAVLKDIRKQNVDMTVFLGDIALGDLYPRECLSLLLDIQPLQVIKGNADGAFEEIDELELINPGAIGYSFDGDPRPGYGVLTVEKKVHYEQKYIEYAVDRYIKDLRQSDYPYREDLSTQLINGESNRAFVCPNHEAG